MIGIFDSGIGGLTVVREILRHVPDAAFVYLGDTARTPYGNKSSEVIRRYALEDAAFLVAQGATSIVIACNSASATAVEAIRDAYPDLPVYDVITPAVQDALALAPESIAVIGTRATIGSNVYQHLLDGWTPAIRVHAYACPLFVPLVEEGWLGGPIVDRVIASYLDTPRTQGVDTVILGCTHYPLLKQSIRDFMGESVRLIDSAESMVKRLVADARLQPGDQRYFFSDVSGHTTDIATKWLERDIDPKLAVLGPSV